MSKEEFIARYKAKKEQRHTQEGAIVETSATAALDSNLKPTVTPKEKHSMAKKTSKPLTDGERALLEKLRVENEALKKGAALYCKVSEKGALSVYGLGRFPVTLYKEQWGKLIRFIPTVEQFLHAHEEEFSTKG